MKCPGGCLSLCNVSSGCPSSPTPEAGMACSLPQDHSTAVTTVVRSRRSPTSRHPHAALLLPAQVPESPSSYGKEAAAAEEPSPGSPVVVAVAVAALDGVVPAECFARVYEAIQDEKWNGGFRKANHSNSTLKTSAETSSLCVCENEEYIVFHCLEDCFLILKSQAVFFQRDL